MIKKIQGMIIPLIGFSLMGCNPEKDPNLVKAIQKAKLTQPNVSELLWDEVPDEDAMIPLTEDNDPFEAIFRPDIRLSSQHSLEGRPIEVLERYSLDTLRMVGSLKRLGQYCALIRDQKGIIHLAKIGDRIGRLSGKIEDIQESYIRISEDFPLEGILENRSVVLSCMP
jgi:Tfp pilus assembly protein PilP